MPARDWPTIAPLFVLILVLFTGYTPYFAAFWGITGCMLVGLAHYRAASALVLAIAIGVGALPLILAMPMSVAIGLVIAARVLLRQALARKAAVAPA